MEEAYIWDAKKALAWARSKKHWPKRRWRLEGSRAGNSRLLRETQAINMKSLYGGTIVELIPAGKGGRKTRFEVAAEDMPRCPYCKQRKNRPCKASDGSPRMPHAKREQLAEKKRKKS
jgi:hypothetical protein